MTDVARQIVTRFGMTEELGHAVLEEPRSSYLGETVMDVRQRDYSEATAREVDLAVRELIGEAYDRAKAILDEHRNDLEDGVKLLLEKETITPDEFRDLVLRGVEILNQSTIPIRLVNG